MSIRITMKDLEEMKKNNRIKDFKVPEKHKGHSAPGRIVTKHFERKSEGKNFIGWNILYWCNENMVELQEEYKFHPERKWKFDWAIPALKVAVEFEGGIHDRNGSHTAISNMSRDLEKYNEAAALGWRVIRLSAIDYKTLIQALNKYKP